MGDLWIRMPVYASGSVVMKHRMESHHVSWARNVELSGPVPGVDTSHESLACRLDALAEDMLRFRDSRWDELSSVRVRNLRLFAVC